MGHPTTRTGTSTRKAPTKGSLSLTDAYLLLYNTACAVGWNLTVYKIGTALLEGGGVRDAVNATHDLVVALQLLSTLELVHAFVGLVRGMRNIANGQDTGECLFFSLQSCKFSALSSSTCMSQHVAHLHPATKMCCVQASGLSFSFQ